ncbi:non-classical arabinogalactan protein 31-like [Ostrinia furnacalis]|uniref:non-classical arabinogalactan protein 31-like n=1 Tax=Ostrinia furnacalis TaxID=93504 RepID=UPI00103DAA15|nr:non-classical arabinogalactan protein 31-like [Ostrinia furnacalis]
MGRLCTIIFTLVAATLSTTMAACPRANSKLLDDILSPANAERALQILRLAAAGARATPSNTGFNLLEDIVASRYLPSTVLPAKPLVQELRRIPLPRRQPVVEVAPAYTQEVYPPVVAPTVVQERVYPAMPIPQPCAVATATPVAPEVYPSAPVPMVNPFLPAASPVSAIAPPTSSLLPPMDPTQVRSHFLRKIPIPPPSL